MKEISTWKKILVWGIIILAFLLIALVFQLPRVLIYHDWRCLVAECRILK